MHSHPDAARHTTGLKQGKNGLWTSPDGRVVLYPHWHNNHGYLVETPAQEKRIRRSSRVATIEGLIALVPIIVASRLADSSLPLVAALILSFAVDYAITRWVVRGFAIVPEPMSLLRRLRLRAAGQSVAFCVLAVVVYGAFGVAAIPVGLGKGDLLAGLVLSAICALACFAAFYTLHTKRSTQI